MTAVIDALQYAFMQRALMAGVLVAIACGIIGTYVVVNRVVFVSGGIAHAAYGGIGMGYFFGFNPVYGAVTFSVVAAIAMGLVQRRTRERSDTLIGVMWAVGMAIGIIFVDRTQGYKVDLMSFLFGSILAVPAADLVAMLVLDAVVIAVVVAFYKELLALSFDETYATVQGIPVDAIYLLLLCMIALTVVMMMRVVGLIMVIALLTMPAAVSGMFVRDMKRMMILSCALGIVFITVGLWLSYIWNLTSGAAIIMVSAFAYGVGLLVNVLRRRKTQARLRAT